MAFAEDKMERKAAGSSNPVEEVLDPLVPLAHPVDPRQPAMIGPGQVVPEPAQWLAVVVGPVLAGAGGKIEIEGWKAPATCNPCKLGVDLLGWQVQPGSDSIRPDLPLAAEVLRLPSTCKDLVLSRQGPLLSGSACVRWAPQRE